MTVSLMTFVRRTLPGAALVCAVALVTSVAAQDGSLRSNVSSVQTGAYPDAQLVLNIEDTSGASLDGLTKDNFKVLIDGGETEVTAAELASSTTSPLDVLLMIDTSGSTLGEGLSESKQAAVAFIQALAPEDRVAIMRFANSVTVQQDFTTDKAAAIAAVNGLVSNGQTELYKAAAGAINQAATSTSSRRAIVFLTDGAQDAIVTEVTPEQALALGASSGIPVYTIALGAAIQDSSFIRNLASASGGAYLEAPAPSDLTAVYQSVGRLLQNQYLITFDGSAAAGKPQSAITVRISSGSRSASADAVLIPGPDFVAPNITITGITAGEAIEEPRDVTVSAGTLVIERVAFYVDGVNVLESVEAPFAFTYDPDRYGGGEHSFRVAATIDGKAIRSEAVTFSSVPGEVIDSPATDGSGGGGGLPIIPIAGIAGLAVVGFIGYLIVGRIRKNSIPALTIASPDQRVTPWAARHRSLAGAVGGDDVPDPVSPVEEVGEALGVLISRSGSDAGTEYAVGAKPVSIGSGSGCAVHINDRKLASEEARIWIRKSNLMFHRLSRLTTIATDGVTGGWQMLEPGETFEIGEHVFEFRLLPEGAPVPDAVTKPPADVPNILRDRGADAETDKPDAPPARPLTPQPGMADTRTRLTEMMPREMGFEHQDNDDDPAAQAS